MAVVYRARLCGPGEAKKEVALKLIGAHLRSDPGYLRLFLNELQVSMGLSHRNIVQTFDAGCQDLTYYMVMELVVGCSLSGYCDRSRGGSFCPWISSSSLLVRWRQPWNTRTGPIARARPRRSSIATSARQHLALGHG